MSSQKVITEMKHQLDKIITYYMEKPLSEYPRDDRWTENGYTCRYVIQHIGGNEYVLQASCRKNYNDIQIAGYVEINDRLQHINVGMGRFRGNNAIHFTPIQERWFRQRNYQQEGGYFSRNL